MKLAKPVAAVCLAAILALSTGCVSIHMRPPFANGVGTNGVREERGYDVGEFTGIVTEGNMNRLKVHLADGENALRVYCDTAYFDELEIDNRSGTLYVSTDAYLFETIDVYVAAPLYETIECRGAAEFIGEGAITGEGLTLDIAGAAGGGFEVETDSLSVNLAGAGGLKLSGSADELEISVAGACDIDAGDLASKTCQVDLAGAGRVEVRCAEELAVTMGGFGSVEYWGSPSLRKVGGGIGRVERLGD